MDIKISSSTNHEVITQIKKIRPEIPIIALTTYNLYQDIENDIKTHFDDYIITPSNKKSILKILNKYRRKFVLRKIEGDQKA